MSERTWPGIAGLTRTRLDFDQMLATAAVDAGAVLRTRTTVTGPILDRNGRVVGVTATGPDKEPLEFHAPLVIAADGVSGRFALALGDASTRGAIVIAAAGYCGRNTGSPLISRHSVVPVASCDEGRTTDAQFDLRGINWAARPACAPLGYQSQLQQRE